ncbi:MAG: preprotein translocase subunit SecG [Maricaulis sp.]|jgi:preprotein translocase subunit SecG|nr:preprotein translocase subunit SecG [Maricaulis sp.]HAQ35684.1 preprotein translocase subunit SecG [Alphaproteobacteria bacterium]
MTTVLLVIYLLVTLALVIVVLMQRSEGGALGMGGGPGGMMTGRGAANVLTRTTMVLGVLFFIMPIALAIMLGSQTNNSSVFDEIDANALPVPAAVEETPDEPAVPTDD